MKLRKLSTGGWIPVWERWWREFERRGWTLWWREDRGYALCTMNEEGAPELVTRFFGSQIDLIAHQAAEIAGIAPVE